MHDFLTVCGNESVSDPGLVQLRRYLPVLAVIGAPYAGSGGNYEPINALDPVTEWAALIDVLGAVPDCQGERAVPLALARLLPPTPARLRDVLLNTSADGFRVVHIVASGDAGALALEDEFGQEYLIGTEPFAQLFAEGSARVVVLDGCFTPDIADLLVERTPVQAVIGTRRRLPPPNAAAFSAHLYAALSEGQDLYDAFRAGVRALERMPGGGADRYELVMRDEQEVVDLHLPRLGYCADAALLLDGQPRVTAVPLAMPLPVGFIGRMGELTTLARNLPNLGELLVIAGPTGVGKSWLAAMAVERFGWRYPDGVLWLTCGSQTTTRELIVQIARVAGVPETLSPDGLVELLQDRQVLVVLDDVDQIAVPDEAARIVRLAQAICLQTPSRVMGTSRGAVGALLSVPEAAVLWLERLDHKAARTLAMRLAVERGLDVLDVDTIDDFMDSAQGIPWLIAAGVGWIEQRGIHEALRMLALFPSSEADPLAAQVLLQLEQVREENRTALRLLRRAAGLPDAFDHRLALGLGGEGAPEQIAQLIEHDLMIAEGDALVLPPLVRLLVTEQLPLEPAHRAQVDRVVMTYLTHIWPVADPAPVLSRREWARLNNTRALLRRYLIEQQGGDLAVMGRLITVAAETFRAVGLGAECSEYAQRVLARLPEGNDPERVRLQIAFAVCAQDDEAMMTFEHVLVQPDLDPALVAEAGLAYGRSLFAEGQADEASAVLADAFAALRSQSRPDIVLAAGILHTWGRALGVAQRDADAIERYRETLQAYTRLERSGLAAQALYELGELLARNSDEAVEALDRAEDLQRRALASADQFGDRLLAVRIRAALAALHLRRADNSEGSTKVQELEAADSLLTEARRAALVEQADARLLAEVLHQHGHIRARLGSFAEAADAMWRSGMRYARLGDAAARATVLVDYGRYAMAAGDSLSAQDALHQAFDLGTQFEMPDIQTAAAGVLVRVHQIRARHARRADADFLAYTVQKAQESRTLLGYHGFEHHAAALDQVIASLA